MAQPPQIRVTRSTTVVLSGWIHRSTCKAPSRQRHAVGRTCCYQSPTTATTHHQATKTCGEAKTRCPMTVMTVPSPKQHQAAHCPLPTTQNYCTAALLQVADRQAVRQLPAAATPVWTGQREDQRTDTCGCALTMQCSKRYPRLRRRPAQHHHLSAWLAAPGSTSNQKDQQLEKPNLRATRNLGCATLMQLNSLPREASSQRQGRCLPMLLLKPPAAPAGSFRKAASSLPAAPQCGHLPYTYSYNHQ
jgi:hypothetical protein